MQYISIIKKFKSNNFGGYMKNKNVEELMQLSNIEGEKNTNTGATLRFYRDYAVDDEETGQLVKYDCTTKEFDINEGSILNIEGNSCNTRIKIKRLTNKYVKLEIEDSHIFIMKGKSIVQTIDTKIQKGGKYEYIMPSAYLIRIEYI